MNLKTIEVGSFKVVSGKVRITDPCYSLDTWCAGTVDKVAHGTWNVIARMGSEKGWGERVWELEAVFVDSGLADHPWKDLPFEVGVDSGQAGIFDLKYYRDDSVVPENAELPYWMDEERMKERGSGEKWYGMCCEVSYKEEDGKRGQLCAGIVPYGVNSSSGYGDGGYRAYVKRNDAGYAVELKIVFISDEDFEDAA